MAGIGEYLKQLRLERDWSLRDLSARCENLSIGFLSDLERGRTDPSLKSLCRLAIAYGVGAGDLLVGAGYTVRDPFAVISVKRRIVTRLSFEVYSDGKVTIGKE